MCGGDGGARGQSEWQACGRTRGRQAAASGATAAHVAERAAGATATRTAGSGVRRDSGAHGRREAIQVPVACISPAEQARTMMFMLYFSFRKRKP